MRAKPKNLKKVKGKLARSKEGRYAPRDYGIGNGGGIRTA
jgi:hypothetical protein